MECRKVKFVNEEQALFYIDKLQKTSKREKKPVSAYLCPHCLSWHLTSQVQKEDELLNKYKKMISDLNAQLRNKNELITTLNLRISELKKKNKELRFSWRNLNNKEFKIKDGKIIS